MRYKGLAKNQAQLFSLFGLANLLLAMRCEGRIVTVSVRLESLLLAGYIGW